MSHKIAMIGAGSVVFSRNLTGDLLFYPEFADATFSYMDVDADRLEVGASLCRKVARAMEISPTIETTTDRRAALRDANFVVCMVQIGGFNSTLVDFEIPRKYGLNFTIADTTGPGGVFRALRTFPLMRDMARDIMDVAHPGCWLLNYSNPMSMNMQSLYRTTPGIKAVGLCHSVQGTHYQRCRDIDVDHHKSNFVCAGINHMAFYLKLELDGQDLYPRLFEVAADKVENSHEAVRYELMRRLGYAVTESSEHNAEYSAHFIPHEGYVGRYRIPLDEYLRRCDGIVDEFERLVAFARSDEPIDREKLRQTHEYGSRIAHAIVTGEPAVVYGNMPNNGAIKNLPGDAIVEVPTLVDKNGCRFTTVGDLPPQLINYMMPHVTQHELFIRAALEGRRDHVYQACFADPLTAATLPMDKIVEMCDELIAAHGMEKDGGTLPDLDAKKTLVPISGKSFSPPTPQELRASWDQAKRHTSDEDVVKVWHVCPSLPDDDALRCVAGEYERTGEKPPLDWREVHAGEDDVVKFGGGKIVAFAEIDSVHDHDTTLRVRGGRGMSYVWFNGRMIHEGSGATLTVTMRSGKNTLFVTQPYASTMTIYVKKPNF